MKPIDADNQKRIYLLHTCRGLLKLLDECCGARNIHQVANLKVSLVMAEGILNRHDGDIEKVREQIERVYERTRKLYAEYQDIKKRTC